MAVARIVGRRRRGRARVGAGRKEQGQGGRGPSIVSITKGAVGIASREFLSEYELLSVRVRDYVLVGILSKAKRREQGFQCNERSERPYWYSEYGRSSWGCNMFPEIRVWTK